VAARNKILPYVLITLLSLFFIIPFAFMVLGSFQKTQIASVDPLFWIPKKPTLFNYEYILSTSQFVRWIVNSLIMTLIPVASQVFLGTVVGYIFAKKRFKGREIYFWMLMSVIMIPGQLLIIPRYIMFAQFGWVNTYASIIVPELYGIIGIFLVRQFMQTIPKELEESARMDGAGDFSIFFRVIMPLSGPAMATIGTFTFIHNWNEFFTPLIYMSKESMYPLTVGLSTLMAQEHNFGIEMAGAVISFLPTLIIYLFFQRYFTEGISMTGLK
jgi:multiple sugar transport system permease protein